MINQRGIILNLSLDNLRRIYEQDQDVSCIKRFLDAALASPRSFGGWSEESAAVYFCLEPSDYAEAPQLREPVSERLDRVAVHFDAERNVITWVTRSMLERWQVSREELTAQALANLGGALTAAQIDHFDIDGVRLGHLTTRLPFKTALVLAPNLKEIVAPALGWPLLAVAPDRDFLYLWDARHDAMIERMGRVVVREFNTAPYPLTTEVLSISDEGISAIGCFPSEDG